MWILKKEAKHFVSTLCNHIISKSPLTSYFARCFNPISLAEIPDTCEKRFHNFLQKFVDGKLITSLFADEVKREFHKLSVMFSVIVKRYFAIMILNLSTLMEFRIVKTVKWVKESCWVETDWIRCCLREKEMSRRKGKTCKVIF